MVDQYMRHIGNSLFPDPKSIGDLYTCHVIHDGTHGPKIKL